jgi:hypothetical protein
MIVRRMPESVEIAKTFAAYVMGSVAHDNDRMLSLGPSRKEGSDSTWNLDHTNNYWLHIDRDTGRVDVTCRYDSDLPVIEAMIALYKVTRPHTIEKDDTE